MQAKSEIQVKAGDIVVVHGHTTGDHGRTGVIVEVLDAASGHERRGFRSRALPRALGRGARIALLARLRRDRPAGKPPQAPRTALLKPGRRSSMGARTVNDKSLAVVPPLLASRACPQRRR